LILSNDVESKCIVFFLFQDLEEVLTFKKLVPPSQNDRLQAARAFEKLLGLAKEMKINLEQPTLSGDIYIILLIN